MTQPDRPEGGDRARQPALDLGRGPDHGVLGRGAVQDPDLPPAVVGHVGPDHDHQYPGGPGHPPPGPPQPGRSARPGPERPRPPPHRPSGPCRPRTRRTARHPRRRPGPEAGHHDGQEATGRAALLSSACDGRDLLGQVVTAAVPDRPRPAALGVQQYEGALLDRPEVPEEAPDSSWRWVKPDASAAKRLIAAASSSSDPTPTTATSPAKSRAIACTSPVWLRQVGHQGAQNQSSTGFPASEAPSNDWPSTVVAREHQQVGHLRRGGRRAAGAG